MKTPAQRAALAATTVALRATGTTFSQAIDVDEAAGVLRGVALMNVGEASGHGFTIDAVTLTQVRDLLNAAGEAGVKVRFQHPGPTADGMIPDDLGDVIGVVKNGRIENDSLRGDVYLADYAEVLPGLGDVRTYLIRRAKANPGGFGMSAVIAFTPEPVTDAAGDVVGVVARVTELDAIDVVGRGAATPNGLLSKQAPVTQPIPAAPVIKAPAALTKKGIKNMDPKIKQYLSANHGLAADATDEAAQTLLDSLSDTQKSVMTAKLSEQPADDKSAAQMAAKNRKGSNETGDNIDPEEQLIALATKRASNIRQLAAGLSPAKIPEDLILREIGKNSTVAQAQTAFLVHITNTCGPVRNVREGDISVGEDNKVVALKASLSDAICLRGGTRRFYKTDDAGRVLRDEAGNAVKAAAHEMAQKYTGLSVLDMYRQWLIAHGAPAEEVHMLSRPKLAELMGPSHLHRQFPKIAMLAQSTGDFANIVLDAQNKSMRMGYVEAARTWNLWASRGAPVPDFKNINRIQTSEVGTLTQRTEGQPIAYTILTDSKETYTLSEYANGIILTRRLLINDDMGALASVPTKQGQAAARLEDDVAYAVLLANANLADGGALFNTTAYTVGGTGHANQVASGGGAPTVTTVAATEKLIMLQKGPRNAAILNLEPKILICPIAIKTTSQQFVASAVDPTKNNATPNPYNGKLQVVPNARLDNGVTLNGTTYAGSSTAWFLLASPADGQIDTVEVSHLQDEPEPVFKTESNFDSDDVKLAVRHVVAAKALDFRGMAKNPGA